VARLYDGRLRNERFVNEVAYALFVRGAELEAAGNREAALAAYREVVAEDPDSVEAWTRIGAVTCRGGASPDEAFAQAEKLDPDYAPLWRARAECAGHAPGGKLDLAAAEHAFALDPDSPDTIRTLLRALDVHGLHDRAWALLQELVVRAPTAEWLWSEVAAHPKADDAWREHARRRIAELDFARTAGRTPHAADPHEAAERALAAGKPAEARVAMERRAAADPGDTDARLLATLAADRAGAADGPNPVELPPGADPPGDAGRRALAELLARHVGAEAAALWLGGSKK
jgi:tetratricopeptide (TPR) repeat protein